MIRFHPSRLQDSSHGAPIGGVVIRHQDQQSLEVFELSALYYLLVLDHSNLRREVETTTFPGLALHPDLALHHLHQAARDRQAQSSAPEPAAGRCVCLGKRLEDGFLLFRWNANPGVAHSEVQPRSIRLPPFQGHAQLHFASTGELDGIPQQVGEDLGETIGIRDRRKTKAPDFHISSAPAAGLHQQARTKMKLQPDSS
jgi:hypothetical protein